MRVFTIVLFILSWESSTIAQGNLIKNGSFENYKWLPAYFLNFKIDSVVHHWTTPTNGSPDYFSSKTNNIPSSTIGDTIFWDGYSRYYTTPEPVEAQSGESFVGLIFGTSNGVSVKTWGLGK